MVMYEFAKMQMQILKVVHRVRQCSSYHLKIEHHKEQNMPALTASVA